METHHSQSLSWPVIGGAEWDCGSFSPFQLLTTNILSEKFLWNSGGKWKIPQAYSSPLSSRSATSVVLEVPRTDSPLPATGFFSKHLVKSSAIEPAWLLGSSKVYVWEQEQPGPRAWPGHSGPAGGLRLSQPKVSASGHILLNLQSTSDYREGLTQGMMLWVWGGMEKGFQDQYPLHGGGQW